MFVVCFDWSGLEAKNWKCIYLFIFRHFSSSSVQKMCRSYNSWMRLSGQLVKSLFKVYQEHLFKELPVRFFNPLLVHIRVRLLPK